MSTREKRTRVPPLHFEPGPASSKILDPSCLSFYTNLGSPEKKKPRKAKKQEVAANPKPTRVDLLPENCTERRHSSIQGAGFGLFASRDLEQGVDLGPYSDSFVCGDEALKIIGDGQRGNLSKDFVHCTDEPACIKEGVEGPWLLSPGEGPLKYINAAPPEVEPNIGITRDGRFVTLRPIKADEELLTYYGPSYWKDVAAHSAKKPIAEGGQCIYEIRHAEPSPPHVALQTAVEQAEAALAAATEAENLAEALQTAAKLAEAALAAATEAAKLAKVAFTAAKLAMEAHAPEASVKSVPILYRLYDQAVGIFIDGFGKDHQAVKNTQLLMSELSISDGAPVYVIAADPGQDSFAGVIESGTQSVAVYFHRGSSFYIVYIHVPDTQRGHGNGRELVQLLRDQATEYGATQLKVTLQTCVRDAGGFFEKCGFESAQACHGAVPKNDSTRDELTLHLFEGRSLRGERAVPFS